MRGAYALLCVAVMAGTFAGCGEDAPVDVPSGAKDAAGPDAPATKDASMSIDARESGGDVGLDTAAIDGAMEAAPEASSDAQADVPDVMTDGAKSEAGPDVSGDGSSDTSLDSASDVQLDGGTDREGAVIGADAVADAGTVADAGPPSCGPPGATVGWIDTISAVGSGVRATDRAVWMGDALFVYNAGDYNTMRRGAIWKRSSRIWSPINLTNAPQSLDNFGIVWTGSRVVIWGGITTAGIVNMTNAGWLYDPIGDAWSAMGGTGAPAARQGAILLWNGSQVVVWDGTNFLATNPTSGWGQLAGGMWDPSGPTWTGIPALSPKGVGTRAVWASTGLLLTGGTTELGTSGRHDFWVPPAAAWPAGCAMTNARRYASLVWAGTRAILWGGREGDAQSVNPVVYVGTGLLIEPGNCTATTIAAAPNAPSPRSHHTAVWTGSRMIVFGGNSGTFGGTRYSDGASYDPAQDQWFPLEPGTPGSRASHQAFWSGTEMIIWGSSSNELAGCVYKP